MRKIAISLAMFTALLAVACVTINVYFPEAAAVEAADRIIDKVRGEESVEPTTRLQPDDRSESSFVEPVLAGIGRLLISEAHAQEAVDFDKPSPENAEIARLNNHPEWQDSIRRTFARRWVAKADKGWYYREGGDWRQK